MIKREGDNADQANKKRITRLLGAMELLPPA